MNLLKIMDKDIKDRNGVSLNSGRPLINGSEFDWGGAEVGKTRLIVDFGPAGHEVGWFNKVLPNDNVDFRFYDQNSLHGKASANSPKSAIWVDVNFESPMSVKKSELKEMIKECIKELKVK